MRLTIAACVAGCLLAATGVAVSASREAPAVDGAKGPQTPARKPVQLAAAVGAAAPRMHELPAARPDAGSLECGGRKVGYIEAAPAAVGQALQNAAWRTEAGGVQVIRTELHSSGATGLRVQMTDPGNLELWVYDPHTRLALGPYTCNVSPSRAVSA